MPARSGQCPRRPIDSGDSLSSPPLLPIIQTFLQAGLLLLASIAFGVGQYFLFSDSAPALYLHAQPLNKGEITASDAWGRSQIEEIAWVDARSEEVFNSGHAPGAFLLNEQNYDSAVETQIALSAFYDKPVFVYCDAAQCKASHKMAERLRAIGYAEVLVVKGGWKELAALIST